MAATLAANQRSSMRRFTRVPLLAALATAGMTALSVTAAPAHAGTNESIKVGGGKASFIAHGEGVAAWDTSKDGRCMAAIVEYRVFSGNPLHPWEKFSATARACGVGHRDLDRLSIPEGTKVKLWACYSRRRAGKQQLVQCSDPQYATA